VVLYMHGDFSYYAARIASRVVAAYVDKQRRLDHNLPMEQAKQPEQPAEVGAVWSASGPNGTHPMRAGHFFVDAPRSTPEELSQDTTRRITRHFPSHEPESPLTLAARRVSPSEPGTLI